MAFGGTGFAALRLQPQPQVFQALSLGARAPVPPSPPFGTPNQNLVPVSQPHARGFTANLTLAAQPIFAALLKLNPTIVGRASPGVAPAPNTTSNVGAQNPSVSQVGVSSQSIDVSAPVTPAANAAATSASGPVTFTVNAAAKADVSIAVGSTVQTANGTQFTVVADRSQPGYRASQNAYVIQPGQTSVTATVQATVPGTSGNAGAQSVTQFSSPGTAPSGVSVTNVTSFGNGTAAGTPSPLLANVKGDIAAGNVTVAGISTVEVPQAPVSFSLTQSPAYATSGQNVLERSLQKIETSQSAQSAQPANAPTPDSKSPQYVPPANSKAVARIVSTVTQLAASAIYPAPIFSFSA